MKLYQEDIKEVTGFKVVCTNCGEDWFEMWWENFLDNACPCCGEKCEMISDEY